MFYLGRRMHEHINDVRVAMVMVMARILFIATKWAKVTKSSQCVVTPMTGRDTGHMTLTHSSVPHHHALDGLHRDHEIVIKITPISETRNRGHLTLCRQLSLGFYSEKLQSCVDMMGLSEQSNCRSRLGWFGLVTAMLCQPASPE